MSSLGEDNDSPASLALDGHVLEAGMSGDAEEIAEEVDTQLIGETPGTWRPRGAKIPDSC